MKALRALGFALPLALAACQTTSLEQRYYWVRTDGQRASGDPKLETQFEIDRTVCLGEVQKSARGAPMIYYEGLSGAITASMMQIPQQQALLDIMKGCMAGRGYLLVPKTEAEAVAARFRQQR
jgi:hypothetical protein